ncbi:MAG: peptidylprolyl isomerase [Coraliomargarita sp.]
MISWIQNHLIRHGRWIFITLLVIVIVAFVFTIGNTPGCTTNRSSYVAQEFYGYDLNSPRDTQELGQKINLSTLVNTGRPMMNDQQFQMALPQRIAMLYLADQLGIPSPDQEALAEYIQSKPLFFGPDGNFSRDQFTRFADNIETNPEYPKGLFVTVMAEDFRIDQVRNVMSGPGFVLPAEARVQTQRNQTTYSLSTGSIAYADFEPEIADDADALKAYYEANQARYEIPERVEASYAFFPTKNYLETDASHAEAALREHFISKRAQFVAEFEAAQPKPEPVAEGEEASEKPAVTFEDVKDAVAADYTNAQAEKTANDAAQAFALTLYNDSIERDSAAFNSLLSEYGVSLQSIEPFTESGASQRALPAGMLQEAFGLGQRYYSSVYPMDGGFAILFLNGKIAPVIPPYEDVADEVAAGYKAEQKRELFSAKGESLKTELDAKLAEGSAFAEAAEALELTVADFTGFEFSEPPAGLDRAVLQQAQNLENGELSEMITTASEIGIFVYLAEKEIPEIDASNEDFTEAETWLKQLSQYISTSALSSELIGAGLEQQ